MQELNRQQNMKKIRIPIDEPQKKATIQPDSGVDGNFPQISVLVNSAYFFIQSVFILEDRNRYRLFALHRGKVITDKSYRTTRGARIAFAKFHRTNAWRSDIKPQWTPFYTPESWWLDNKFETFPPR